MNNKGILEKAIAKAIEGGWLPYFATFDPNMTKDKIVIGYTEGSSSVNFDYEMKGHVVGVGGYDMEPYSIIFNHDFAKALWGEDGFTPTGGGLGDYSVKRGWKYHLQQMVIADDPIKYLGEHLSK